MIEEVHRSQVPESRFLMTPGTVIAEFSFMDIVVASGTVIFSDPFLILKNRSGIKGVPVAEETTGPAVSALQFKRGELVIEPALSGKPVKTILRMTGGTFSR